MPRYDPGPVNQFIVPDDPYALPPQAPKHKRGKSISALERIAVFTEVTQRVKRRLRNAIAGAVGASSGVGIRTKRKSQDAMNVDSVWNGWHAPIQHPITVTAQEPQSVEIPEPPVEYNRFSVVMKDNWSVSDLSMRDGEQSSAPTPRATTPEPATPKYNKTFIVEPHDEEEGAGDDEEGTEYAGEEEEEEENSSPTQHIQQLRTETPKRRPLSTVGSLTPMDEDPPTPKAPTSAPQQVVKSPKPTRRQSTQSTCTTRSQQKTPTLASRTSSTESSPPKTPKLTLQTNFNKTPVAEGSNFVLAGLVDNTLSTSPVGLGLGLSFGEHSPVYGRQESMEVVLPTALLLEHNTFATILHEEQELKPLHMKVADIPSLLPAANISEKKSIQKPKSRRGSLNTDPPSTCTSRRAAILAHKRNASKNSLGSGVVDQSRDSISAATLRAQIDALPNEQQESPSRWKPWLHPQLSSPFGGQRVHLAPQPLSLFTPPTHTSSILH